MASTNPMSTWEPFPLSESASSHPPLFIRRDFSGTEYSVYLTDLSNIWGESLSKSRVLDKAEDTETSIDPSADRSQLGILLSKLRDGLVGGGGSCNGDVDVELDIRKSADHSDEGCQIHIMTRETLPKPLRPLVWKFRLRPLPQDQLTNLVILPALASSALLARQVESLLAIIEEKDGISQRMLDKLREFKVDLRSVFPGRKISSSIDEHVRFDESKWRHDVGEEEGEPQKRKAIDVPFGTVDPKLQAAHSGFGHWWTGWEGKQKLEKKRNEVKNAAPTTKRETTLTSESSFERLKTPPRRTSPRAQSPLARTAKTSDSTDDEDDDDAEEKPHRATSPAGNAKEKSRETRRHDPIKEENVDSSATAMDDQLEEAVKVDDDETTDDEVEGPPSPPPVKKGLIRGKIGGKKAEPAPDVEMKSNDDSEDEDVSEPVPKKSGKVLKTIGKKKAPEGEAQQHKRKVGTDDEDEHENGAGTSRPSHTSRVKSPEQDDPAEAVADRKRAELAKKLEEQRKAPPKKHRRF